MASLRRQPEPPSDFGPLTTFVATIPVSKWTRLMQRLVRARPLRVSVDTSYGFRHPWHCRAAWNPTKVRREIEPNTAYVNHREVLVEVRGTYAPALTLVRLVHDPSPRRLRRGRHAPWPIPRRLGDQRRPRGCEGVRQLPDGRDEFSVR